MSQLENCPVCQNPTSENATVCPSCGEPFEPGWAFTIREKRADAKAEELRLENEELDRQDQIRAQAVIIENKAKKKKLRIRVIAITVIIFAVFGPILYDNLYMNSLKKNNPQEYQKIIDKKNQEEKQATIDQLVAKAAKIPATEYIKNLTVYKELNALDPKNDKYISKINLYEKKIQSAALLRKEELEIEKEAAKEHAEFVKKNYTGMWAIGHYVDDFGEPTKQKYIANRNHIKGTFSNSATQDSKLNIQLLINGSSSISIQLYEYAGNNPVKAYSSEPYRILVQDTTGHRETLRAVNWSNRLELTGKNAKSLHKMLMKGGLIKFKIVEIDTPTTNYKFSIPSADGYSNAYRKFPQK